MCTYSNKTDKTALYELAKALKHFYNLDPDKMHPGDLYTAGIAEKLVRGIIEDNGYTATYLKRRGTRLFQFRK